MPGHSQRLLFAGDTMKNSDQTSEHNMNPKHKPVSKAHNWAIFPGREHTSLFLCLHRTILELYLSPKAFPNH